MGQQELDPKSSAYYESVLQKHPEMPEARFGAGWAAYRKGDFSRALSEFESVLSTGEAALKPRTFYNLGNTLHREGRLEESLRAYRSALELKPDDADAKYNYELTRYLLNRKSSSQNRSLEGKEEQGESQRANEEQSESPEHKAQDQPGENETRIGSQRVEKRDKNRPPDAESILNALRADEQNLLKRRLDSGRLKRPEKDW